MGAVELDQLLLLGAIVTGIVLAVSTLVVAVRTRRIQHQLQELDALQRSIQRVEGALGEIGRVVDRMSDDQAQLRDLTERRKKEINRIAKGFRGLQEWKSRVSAISYEAGHLFESEPIRELMDNLGSRPDALTAEPPDSHVP